MSGETVRRLKAVSKMTFTVGASESYVSAAS